MHLKFLAQGTGSAALAAAYLLALKDASGKVRAAVEVLRGDPMLVARVADGLPFKYRYTSAVAAWSPEDAPTRPELEQFVDEFEKSAWAGLDRDRYVWAVVLHRDDDGGVHLHIIAARWDLATGLSLNVAPPGWESTFDPLRDAMNYEYGWSRPDDPSRARPFRPAPHLAYQARAAHRAGEDIEPDPRREIGMHLLELVAAGRVKDRTGVVAALEARGYDVPRQGRHYVTARHPVTGERWRLKGTLYEREFDGERFLREAPAPSADREHADGVDDPAAAAWEAVEQARRRRADYNRAYYGPGGLPGRAGEAAGVEVARASSPAARRSASHDASLAAHLERELGDAAVIPAESTRDRMAAADGGRRVAGAVALAAAARAAGPELSRALSEHVAVRERERAVSCTPSVDEQRLAETQEAVLVEEASRGGESRDRDASLNVSERERVLSIGSSKTWRLGRRSGVSRPRKGVARRPSAVVLKRWKRTSRLRSGRLSRRRGLEGLPRDVVAARRDGVQAGGVGEVERESGPERSSAEAARAAGPELSRLMGEHEDVAARERTVCATAMGEQWLAEAQQEVLAEEEDRPLSVAVRTRVVKTAEDRLETHLSGRAAAVAATSSGPALLQEAFGKRSYGNAPLSFSTRERGLEQVEQRIDEELRTREEALRAIPSGKRYLSAAEQARGGGAAGPPTLADRESMVRAATQQVSEEFDRLEEELLAIAVGEDLLAEAAGVLAGAGRTRSLGKRWEACERVKSGVEEELDRREAAIRADSVGEEFLRDARLAVHGSAEREAATLGDRARIVKAAAEAQQEWNKEKAARVEKLRARLGGLDLYHAHLADRDPKWSLTENTPPSRELDEAALAAAESDDIRLKRLDAVLSDAVDAARYQEVLDQMVGQFTTSDVDNALAAGEKARAERETQQWEERRDARVKELRALPGGIDLYLAHLADLDPKWDRKRNRKSSRENIDAALAAAQSDAPRLDLLRDVLSNEADAAHYREVLDDSPDQFSTATLDRALAAGEGARAEREASALETATEEAQAAAARSNVELRDAHVRMIYETGETHAAGLAAVSRTTEALNAAADQRLPADTIIGTWNGSRSEPGGIAAALAAAAAAVSARRAAALETATEEAQAAAARSNVELRDAHVRMIYETGETHESGLSAVERTTAALTAAADQQLPTATIVKTWNANKSAPGGIAVALVTKTRVSRLERLIDVPRAGEAFIVALDGQDPSRPPTHPTNIDRALDIAEREFSREAEQQFPGASSAAGRTADDVTEAADTDRHVQQVIDRLRTEVEQLRALRARTGTGRLSQRNLNSVRPIVEKSPPVRKLARLVPAAAWEDAAPLERAVTDLETTTEPRRLAERARHAVTGVVEKTPPVPKPARLVPGATWEDAAPLERALTDLTATEPRRLAERARHAVTGVVEKTPPVPKLARLVPDATQKDVGAAALVRAERVQEEERLQTDAAPRLTFAERYSQQWPEHADDIHHPDFEKLADGAEARNELFERRELYSSKWTTAEPEELPISLAKSGAAWTDEAVRKVTWQATPGVGNPERTLSRQIVDAHLDGYGHRLPEQYAHSTEWRAIRERAEEAVRKLQDSRRYKRADRKGDDRQKRKLEADAINRACGRDARRLHKKMTAAREAARPAWEITVRIRAVRDLIRKDGRKLQQKKQARPVHRPRAERGPTRERGQSR